MARSKSSKRWLAEHFDDQFVKLAQQKGLRSRSAFKLLELNEKYRLLRLGMVVVDLGAAPGGWCQVVQPLVGEHGRVIALDVLPMEPLAGVEVIEGDFTEDGPLAALEAALQGQAVDLVLSDMAPNMSGMATVDQARAMYLAELALEFVRHHLKGVPIVAMTAYPHLYPEKRNGNEVEAYFLKPFDIQEMLSTIEKILGG